NLPGYFLSTIFIHKIPDNIYLLHSLSSHPSFISLNSRAYTNKISFIHFALHLLIAVRVEESLGLKRRKVSPRRR
ncbi:hypothetical protein Drorol1_Dr00020504, partial [Drosera rotundifolia]